MKHHLEFVVTLALLRPWSCHFCYGLINIVSRGLWNILQTIIFKLKLAWNLHYVCLEFHQGRSKFLVNVYSASIAVGSKIISKIVWCAAHSRVVRRSVGPPRLDCDTVELAECVALTAEFRLRVQTGQIRHQCSQSRTIDNSVWIHRNSSRQAHFFNLFPAQ